MTLSLPSDKNICNQEIKTSTGRSWKVEVAIGRAIAAERNHELMDAVQSHCNVTIPYIMLTLYICLHIDLLQVL